ncbi:MAG: HIT family protein [Candidatus Falkowbacteria bacterium]
MECIFCKIVAGELPAHKIYEDDYVLAFLDIAPVNPGHVLVITKRCVKNMEEIDDVQLSYVMHVVRKIGITLKKTLAVQGYNVIINNGAVAGQLIEHFHCHVIPRQAGDGLMNWPQKTYPDDEAKKMAARLAADLK